MTSGEMKFQRTGTENLIKQPVIIGSPLKEHATQAQAGQRGQAFGKLLPWHHDGKSS